MIPLTILGGWLGAGKTTLLNRILATADERIAVIVNDIGEINVDASLIAGAEGEIVELTNGCVCCSIGDSLALTLREVTLHDPPPDRIIIEASGVADPAQVAQFGDRRKVPLDAIVTLADAGGFARRSSRPPYGSLLRAQVAGADLVVATKLDLLDPADRADALDDLRSATTAPVVEASDDPGWIRDVVLGPRPRPERAGGDPMAPAHGIATQTWRGGGAVDVSVIERALATPGLLRAKGSVAGPEGAVLVHLAGERIEITPTDDEPLGAIVLIGETPRSVAIAAAALDGADDPGPLSPPRPPGGRERPRA